jgi:2-keto-4-pentenoate hydratase/2-oxohepta-3-ene-1,7-dioic acid hydratase in catechol pathway
MKLVRVSREGRVADGIVDGDKVRIIDGWRDDAFGSFEISRRSLDEIRKAASRSPVVDLTDVRLELPLDSRNKIICVGLNYRDHVGEFAPEIPKEPALFLRHIDSLVGPTDPLVAPTASPSYDYEGEIALVIGRSGRNIAPENALEQVLGYSCFMDGSVRAFQRHSITAGKNFWRSGAMGPWIVTADEVREIGTLKLETRIDGEMVQSTTADKMIFDVPTIIAYCSIWTQLNPGDVISTGTPAGVGAFRKPPRWLNVGETVEVSVSGVGVLQNKIVGQ